MSFPPPPFQLSAQTAMKPKTYQLPELRDRLQRIADERGMHYQQKIALLVHWQNDNTGAKKDVATMKYMLGLFDIPYEEYEIKDQDDAPQFNLSLRVYQMIKKYVDKQQNTLFVFYYVGHARVRLTTGHLELFNESEYIEWDAVRPVLFSHELDRLDTLGILDCCCVGAAARQFVTRTAYLLAACSWDLESKARTVEDEATGTEKKFVSFTQRILNAIWSLRSDGVTQINIPALYGRIQRLRPKEAPLPVLQTFGGVHPITLTMKPNIRVPSSPSRIPRPVPWRYETTITVKLTLEADERRVESAIDEVIANLPLDMKPTIEAAYVTEHSVFLLLQMSWYTWAQWSMCVDLFPVGLTIGPSLLNRRFIEHARNMPLRGKQEENALLS